MFQKGQKSQHNERWYQIMRSPEYRAKQKKDSLARGAKPPIAWGNKINLGRKHTVEWKQERRRFNKEMGIKPPIMEGENHPNWKGGISSFYRVKKALLKSLKRPEQCEICGTFGNGFKRGLCCDHDHKTGKIRGWLCTRCNSVLGFAKDNIETLGAAIEYLKKYNSL